MTSRESDDKLAIYWKKLNGQQRKVLIEVAVSLKEKKIKPRALRRSLQRANNPPKPNKYARYVRDNFKNVKANNPNKSFEQVIQIIVNQYKDGSKGETSKKSNKSKSNKSKSKKSKSKKSKK